MRFPLSEYTHTSPLSKVITRQVILCDVVVAFKTGFSNTHTHDDDLPTCTVCMLCNFIFNKRIA